LYNKLVKYNFYILKSKHQFEKEREKRELSKLAKNYSE